MKRIPLTKSKSNSSSSLNRQNANAFTIRTNSNGRIPISCDWVSIFENLRKLKSYYIQTRHAYARLVAKTDALEMQSNKNQNLAIDRDRRIQICPNKRHRVAALISRCNCCNSPGRIEFRNEYNLEVMQVCCDANTPAINFGKAVAKCASEPTEPPYLERENRIPLVPKEARWITSGSTFFSTFLNLLSTRSIEFIVTLKTTGIVHSERLSANSIEWDDEIMTVMDSNKTLQIGLSGVRGVFVHCSHNALELYLAGSDNAELLAIKATNTTINDFDSAFFQVLDTLKIKIK